MPGGVSRSVAPSDQGQAEIIKSEVDRHPSNSTLIQPHDAASGLQRQATATGRSTKNGRLPTCSQNLAAVAPRSRRASRPLAVSPIRPLSHLSWSFGLPSTSIHQGDQRHDCRPHRFYGSGSTRDLGERRYRVRVFTGTPARTGHPRQVSRRIEHCKAGAGSHPSGCLSGRRRRGVHPRQPPR